MTDNIELPINLIKNGPGFTIDIGGSVAKIVYRSKADYNNGRLIADTVVQIGMVKMRIRMLPCTDIDGVIKVVKEECDITRHTDVPEVFATGVGSNKNREKLEKALNISLKLVSEFDMAIDGTLLVLETFKEPYIPLATDPRKVAEERFVRFQNFLKSSPDYCRAKWVKRQDEEEALSWKPNETKTYPFLGVMCGSMVVFHKVFEDGSYENLDVSEIGGRCVFSLLAQLTDEKDFEELLSMAGSSDGRSADVYASDLRNPQDKTGDPYTKFDNDSLIFPFGKAFDRKDVKPGDAAFSILNIVTANLVQVTHQLATVHCCPHVVFIGNFVSSSVIRDWLTRDMELRNLRVSEERRVRFNFLRHGGILVALGALAASATNQPK